MESVYAIMETRGGCAQIMLWWWWVEECDDGGGGGFVVLTTAGDGAGDSRVLCFNFHSHFSCLLAHPQSLL